MYMAKPFHGEIIDQHTIFILQQWKDAVEQRTVNGVVQTQDDNEGNYRLN